MGDLCYVSMNFAEEVDNFAGKEKTFELPDMSVVTVHNQIIRCPELMFKPSMDGKEMMGLHELAKKTVILTSARISSVTSSCLAVPPCSQTCQSVSRPRSKVSSPRVPRLRSSHHQSV